MKQPQIPFSTLLSQLTDSDSQVRLQALKSIMRRRFILASALPCHDAGA